MRLLALLLLAGVNLARAQTMVLACQDHWGSSSNCGGCTGLVASSPDANDYVKTAASDFWQRLGSLDPIASVSVVSGKTEGQAVKCSDVSGAKTVAELLGAAIPVVPQPPPTTTTGNGTINWTPPLLNDDGTALTDLASYRIEYGQTDFGRSVSVPAGVLTYTFNGLAAGQWQARIVTVSGHGESVPSNPVSMSIVATPPPPPPPTGPVVVAVVAGLNMSPVFGVTSTGARSSTVLGFAPIGTPCTGTSIYGYRSQAYFHVDPSKVVWWATKATPNAAVACK